MSQAQRIIPITVSAVSAVSAVAPGIEPVVRIQPRAVSGRFTRWRWALVWATQLLFYGLPWLQWQGRQAVWFDLDGRRFHVFGAVLFPQDLILLTGLLIFSALLLFAATALFGRVWCGFACPQTVYTSMFMWIEQRAEGDRLARLRLDGEAWSPRKLVRRGGKHAAWLALSLVTGFSLVGWFTPVRELALATPRLAFGPWEAFWILFYGAATYLHAGLLREKVCQHACPYGRFQGAMLDRHSLIVGYDAGRGEPRGGRARGAAARAEARARGLGDCVDCTLCVQVCPVGIDIRQGAQAACISCGLCIDACDQVMDKLGAPRGLVRFGAQAKGVVDVRGGTGAGAGPGGWRAALWRPRVAVYAAGLVLMAGALVWGWVQRPELRLNVMRDRSVIARPVADGAVENLYRLQVLNASMQPRRLQVLAVVDQQGSDGDALAVQPAAALRVEPAGTATAVVSVRMTAAQLARLGQPHPGRPVPIRFIVRDDAEARGDRAGVRAQTTTTFLPGGR